jgi:diphosphomevalonate decarboxylase
MSALALCIIDVKFILENGAPKELDSDFLREASVLARLGSGSACRSVYPLMSLWGKHEDLAQSSQEYGIAWTDVHDVFHSYHDDILIVSKDEKFVSSTAGHGLMVNNSYAEVRYQQAQDRITLLCQHLREGDIHGLGLLAEDEAMTLHALMMCSKPSYVLMRPNTLAIIEKIRSFRGHTNLPLYFTLDAGPNVHLLYPDSIKDEVSSFVNTQLISLCENNTVIYDYVGKGPKRLV